LCYLVFERKTDKCSYRHFNVFGSFKCTRESMLSINHPPGIARFVNCDFSFVFVERCLIEGDYDIRR